MAEPAHARVCRTKSTSISLWWWEIGAVWVGITSIATIVIFLSQVEETSLAKWVYPIQPNTIVSILTTIGKSSMMIPIASCFGQYKWWRLKRPTQLKELQLLDEASRGPWGSMVLFFDIQSREITIAYCLGIITILALGFEPSAQQILSFPTREAQLPNITAKIGAINKTFGFSDLVYQSDYEASELRIDAAFLNAALGSPLQGLFYCPAPATKCSWGGFATLALCGEVTKFNTSSSEISVSDRGSISTYEFPSGSSRNRDSWLATNVTLDPAHSFGTQSWTVVEDAGFSTIKFAIAYYNKSLTQTWPPKDTELYLITWRWCTKTYHNSIATPRGPDFGSVTEENLIHVGEPQPSTYIVENMTEHLLAPSTGITYEADSAYLFSILASKLTQKLGLQVDPMWVVISNTSTSSIDAFMNNVKETFNSMITSNNIIRNQYLQYLDGTAYYEEVYIRVRWVWLILPILEIVLTAVFLVITIVLNHDQRVYKSSILPYLAHGLEGWHGGELDIQSPGSMEDLEKVLFKQTAMLGHVQDGQLKLRLVESPAS